MDLLSTAERLLETFRCAGLRLATAESCTGGLIAAIRDQQPGDSVTLTIIRDGEELLLDVTLTSRP